MNPAIYRLSQTVMAVERSLGASLPDEGVIWVTFDDSIITDMAAEKQQDMAEVAAGLMKPCEYRAKWHGGGIAAGETKDEKLSHRPVM